jgi:hypothetical protein
MSMNLKTFVDYERLEHDRNGRKIHVYRKREMYLDKEEALESRKHRENLKLNVS